MSNVTLLNSSCDRDHIVRIFKKFANIYGSAWTSRLGENPDWDYCIEDWYETLSGFDYKTLVAAMRACLELHKNFPPTLGQLHSLCMQHCGFPEIEEIMEKITRKDFGRHYGDANKRMKQLLNLLFRLDMNVIITSHSKNEYGQNLSILGQTFDCYKKLDYLFDLVFEIQKRGDNRVGIVRKSRIEGFGDADSFPFSYDEIAKRYGRNVLERNAVSQKLASEEQIVEVTRLVDLLKIPDEIVQKWFTKASSESWHDMQEESIQKCIEHLKSKIKGE